MAWRAARDRALKRLIAKFGVDVTYTPPGGGASSSGRGRFDAQHELVTPGPGDVPVSTYGPVLVVRLADWTPAPAVGGTFRIEGVDYEVRDPQLDDEADPVGADLILHRSAYGG